MAGPIHIEAEARMLDGDNLIDRYTNWLKWQSKAERMADGWTKLTVPLLDRHNDHLMVCVKQDPGTKLYLITDDGATIRGLERLDIDVKGDADWRRAARDILRGFGLSELIVATGVICADTTDDRFPQTLNMVLLAMLAIDAMGN